MNKLFLITMACIAGIASNAQAKQVQAPPPCATAICNQGPPLVIGGINITNPNPPPAAPATCGAAITILQTPVNGAPNPQATQLCGQNPACTPGKTLFITNPAGTVTGNINC